MAPAVDPRARARQRLSESSGQVLLLGVLFIVGILLPMLASVGVAAFVLARGGAQDAADAAALAGASQVVVTKKVDALGNVYGYTAEINTRTAPGAAASAWGANAGAFLGGTTAAFYTSIDNNPPPGQGPSISVVGAAKFPDSLLALIGLRPESTVTVQAVAGTCGGTAWRGSVPPWCRQAQFGAAWPPCTESTAPIGRLPNQYGMSRKVLVLGA